MRIRIWAASALVGTAALAGAYDKPWALVEAADRSEVREEFPVAITQVDGRSTRDPRQSDALEPGKHTIRIRFDTARFQQSEAEKARDVELTLEPCTRYRIAARRIQGTQWEPKVYAEAIAECKRKFKQ